MPEDAAKEIVESGDCMSMAAMIAINQNIDRVQDFVNSLDHKDTYCLDRYWILIHELAKRDMLHKDGRFDSYIEDSGLSILSKKSVSFLTIKS